MTLQQYFGAAFLVLGVFAMGIAVLMLDAARERWMARRDLQSPAVPSYGFPVIQRSTDGNVSAPPLANEVTRS